MQFRDFCYRISDHYKVPIDSDSEIFLCLKDLLEKNDHVTVDNMGNFLQWFGPFDGQLLMRVRLFRVLFSMTPGTGYITQVLTCHVLRSWICWRRSGSTATSHQARPRNCWSPSPRALIWCGSARGTYCLSFSATYRANHWNREPGSYAISARAKEQVKHFRVTHKAGENYFIGKYIQLRDFGVFC